MLDEVFQYIDETNFKVLLKEKIRNCPEELRNELLEVLLELKENENEHIN